MNADSGWVIGDSEDIGADEGVMYAPGDVARVELVKSPWRCWDWRQQLIDAGDLEVLSKPVTSAAAKVPACDGRRSGRGRAQLGAEGCRGPQERRHP